jgi:mRNA-degrading endonuclease RelE of RelBE toxin-antitoxin system
MVITRYTIIYDTEVIHHVGAIDRKYHSLIKAAIEAQLAYEPDVEARNRKPLVHTVAFGARWELRFGDNNQFRVFYSIHPEKAQVHVLAIGVKHREQLYIGGKEAEI